MKNFITITLLLLGLYAHSQVTTLPAGSKPLSAQVFIDPDEKLWVGVDGKYYTVEGSGGGGGTGTVTAVGLTAPTGFSVSGSPVTSSGNLTLGFSTGYSLPTTTNQSNWSTAYGWGNHASAGYAVLGTAGGQVRTNTQLDARYIQATDMPAGIPSGGTPGQLLAKLGSSDYDVTWITPAGGTAYSAGTGLTLSGTQFSLPITYSGTGDYVQAVATTTNGITVTRGTLPSAPTYSPSTSITITAGNEIRRAALTGDVTASANSNSLTIANNAVTTNKLASSSVSAAKFVNFASGTYPNGAIIAWAPSSSIQTANYHTFQPYFWIDSGNIGINNFTTSLSGLVPNPGSGSNTRALMANGTWAEVSGGGGISALTGDVTASGTGSVAATIANGAVSNAKMANMSANTIKGRLSSTGVPQDLTAAQVKQMISTVSSGTGVNFTSSKYTTSTSSNITVNVSGGYNGGDAQIEVTNTSGSTITVSFTGGTLPQGMDGTIPGGKVGVFSVAKFSGTARVTKVIF